MIFVDSNVPMYLVGAEHPNKAATVRVLEILVRRRERLVTDVEVFQEMLHRFVALRRHDAIDVAFEALLALVSETFPIDLTDVTRAKDVLRGGHRLSARDAPHVAVMQRYDVDTVLSFDRGFDGYPGLTRLA